MLGCQRCSAAVLQLLKEVGLSGACYFRWAGGVASWLPSRATQVEHLRVRKLFGVTLICCGLPEPPRRKTLTLMASRSPTRAAAPSESAARRSSQGISRSYICLKPPSAASHSVRGHHCCVPEQLPCCSFTLRKAAQRLFVATPVWNAPRLGSRSSMLAKSREAVSRESAFLSGCLLALWDFCATPKKLSLQISHTS